MKKKFYVLFCVLFLVNIAIVFAKQDAPSQGFIRKNDFNGNLMNLSNQMAEAKKNTNQPTFEQLMTHSLEHNDIQYIKVENDSGLQRVFSINDGFQERVLRKVVYWLNNSDRVNGTIEATLDNPSNKLTIKMTNDEVITIEPAYTCVVDNKRNICTAKEGEIIVSENSQKVRLKSQSLYDWLMVGWRKEVDGLTKEELLEEALYSRYLSHLGPSYAEFFMCPKIKIEPIDGDPRRHLIYGSALNYSGHHGGDYNKLTFSVSDSNLTGLQVTNLKIKKHISPEESEIQCRTFE
ncbi:hypothetical protein LZ480_18830 [Solibacillus sp. MA9]|uniref:Uncharacterized protein n=1 Tax=Solibacillus palustris TaxID=2908203 RepID=A0ABS9UHU6_9BACL|nr:hypothetical protein [Solibacillus sp. MA9]MCH7323929.1 hypothetical protein [Solibacillus sp. MA9]